MARGWNDNDHNKILVMRKIVELMGRMMPKSRLVTEIMTLSGKSKATAYRYYEEALLQVKNDHNEDVASVRARKIQGLTDDVSYAYAKFLETDNIMWFKEYQSAKERLDKYYPHKLEVPDENPDIQVNITYESVKKDE